MSHWRRENGYGTLKQKDVKELKDRLIKANNNQLVVDDIQRNKASNRTYEFKIIGTVPNCYSEVVGQISIYKDGFSFETYTNYCHYYCDVYDALERFLRYLDNSGNTYGAEIIEESECRDTSRFLYGSWRKRW